MYHSNEQQQDASIDVDKYLSGMNLIFYLASIIMKVDRPPLRDEFNIHIIHNALCNNLYNK